MKDKGLVEVSMPLLFLNRSQVLNRKTEYKCRATHTQLHKNPEVNQNGL